MGNVCFWTKLEKDQSQKAWMYIECSPTSAGFNRLFFTNPGLSGAKLLKSFGLVVLISVAKQKGPEPKIALLNSMMKPKGAKDHIDAEFVDEFSARFAEKQFVAHELLENLIKSEKGKKKLCASVR